jgi:magnesium chelatase subunit I
MKEKTIGALKKSGYTPISLKDEMRKNLIEKLKKGEKVFEGIYGFEDSVLPEIERAILSRHNILLLGLRGQAKTRIARLLVHLLDEYIPIIKGSEINDDPLNPISKFSLDIIEEMGENTPIEWLHKSDRYVEKLATPDVSIADLIGDVDPIKAATLKLPYSDQRVIHFGLVPRSHRSIFVINELPDLQPRIQVSLFNILQEGDLQIRGFKLRLPLDIQFIFTANPEDYTNRGSIITPLKDRIESQILTHYPKSLDISRKITQQESNIIDDQHKNIAVNDLIKDLVEKIAFEARDSDLVDEKSGVSARLSITAYQNLISTAERRALLTGDKKTQVRLLDFHGIIPSITGKVELVYEGEQEGAYNVAMEFINASIEKTFLSIFPDPEKQVGDVDPYGTLKAYFSAGNVTELMNNLNDSDFKKALDQVSGLKKLASQYCKNEEDLYLYMEMILHGLAELDVLSKNLIEDSISFHDPLTEMFDDLEDGFDE